MAEIGFSLFFVMALVAGIAALGRMIIENRGRIAAALDRRLVAAPAPERILSVRTCAPIDLPYVARRMNRGAAALLPPLDRRASNPSRFVSSAGEKARLTRYELFCTLAFARGAGMV